MYENGNKSLRGEALQTCDELEGSLPTISNEMENKKIRRILKSTTSTSWLGGVYIDGSTTWYDGTSPDPDFDIRWDEGHPHQSCIVAGKSGKWWTKTCKGVNTYICIKDAVNEGNIPLTMITSTMKGRCSFLFSL